MPEIVRLITSEPAISRDEYWVWIIQPYTNFVCFVFRLSEHACVTAFEDLLRLTDYCGPRGQNHMFLVRDQQCMSRHDCTTTTVSNTNDWCEAC
jgi:hypothetical protein